MRRMQFKKPFRQVLCDNTKALEQLALLHGVSATGQQHIAEMRAEVDQREAKAAARKPRAKAGSDGRTIEATVNKEIEAAAKLLGVVLWRNTRGQVLLPNGGRLTYGVGPNGASDYIGYRVVRITQDMVGKRIAQFLAVESKRPGENATEAQAAFAEMVATDGGQSGVAHSGEEALGILRKK